MHSGAEFGIELAAMLHTASTIPQMTMPGDAHYHYLEDDIIQGGKLQYVKWGYKSTGRTGFRSCFRRRKDGKI